MGEETREQDDERQTSRGNRNSIFTFLLFSFFSVFKLQLVLNSDASTSASYGDEPSENEIRRKDKHKQNYPNLPPFLKTV